MSDAFENLIARLEQTAADLRAGDMTAERAAAVVDDLARYAADAGTELDHRVRAGDQPLGTAAQLAFTA